MSPRSARKKRPTPAFPWLSASQTYYSEAFGAKTKANLAAAMEEFRHLDEAERQFIMCHLQWLQIQAIASLRTQAVMGVNALNEALAEQLEPEEEERDEDEPEDVTDDDDPEVEVEGVDVDEVIIPGEAS